MKYWPYASRYNQGDGERSTVTFYDLVGDCIDSILRFHDGKSRRYVWGYFMTFVTIVTAGFVTLFTVDAKKGCLRESDPGNGCLTMRKARIAPRPCQNRAVL